MLFQLRLFARLQSLVSLVQKRKYFRRKPRLPSRKPLCKYGKDGIGRRYDPVLGLVMEGTTSFAPWEPHRIGHREHGLTRNTLVLLVSVDRPTRRPPCSGFGHFSNLDHFPVRLIIIGFCAIEIQNHRLALGRMHGDLHPSQHEIPIRSPA